MISVFNLEETCLETPKRLKGEKEDSHLIVTGTIDDPIYVSSDNSKTTTPTQTPTHSPTHAPIQLINSPTNNLEISKLTPINTPKTNKRVESYYKHKFLLKLRKKQYDNNFDLGLYFLVRFGGPKSSMGASILMDDELLECSELSKFRDKRDLNEWFDFQYKSLYKNLRKRLDFSNLPLSQVNKRLSRELPRKRWFTREKLYNKAIEQENWNPFSIFGSSLPYVSLNDVFNLESSKNYVIGSLKHFLINNTINTNNGTNTNGNNTDNEDERLFNYLSEKWRNESRKVTDWNRDPLLTSEVLWYINATNKYLDKSQNVCILQKCFCVTPDPNIRFNWNDPRCSVWRNYDGPRPSMGEILASSNYKNSLERFNTIKARAEQSNHISQEDDIKLKHYYNYFNLNHY